MSELAIHGGRPLRETPFPGRGGLYGEDDLAELRQVIDQGSLFRFDGRKVREFEEEFARLYGVKHAIACTSGTAAIHVALMALELEPGDEVIVAPVTDAGGLIPVVAQNAIPLPADTAPRRLCMDAEGVAACLSDRTRAIVPVHVAGVPADLEPLLRLASASGVPLIEDCAQAHRAMYRGRYVGTMGRIGCFSLQQSKQLATGEGGVCVTDDDDLGERMRLCMDKGWVRGPALRAYPVMGLNYRMNELTAAVALAQLRKLDDRVAARVRIGDAIGRGLEGIPGVHAPVPAQGDRNTYWFYSLYVDDGVGGLSPVEFASALAAEGIPASHGYVGRPMHLLYSPVLERRAYGPTGCPWTCPHAGRDIQYTPGDCPNAEDALQHLIMIGMNEFYTEREADDIVGAVRKVACSG
ncbi:MAG: DegT/DnrJ/EryC1/StrS family aminotransferase [Armatimonadetes bacterium]|nr:DegT/DnrJ/EryC1/StrS family aminotransferase [Armatimonadota bacterium]